MKSQQIVAKMTRMEINQNNGKLYLVFEVTDPLFHQEMMKDWTQDFEMSLKDDKLIYIKKE
jgi:hypothetical protein